MPDPAFDSADYELLWPRDLFVRELTAVQATAAGRRAISLEPIGCEAIIMKCSRWTAQLLQERFRSDETRIFPEQRGRGRPKTHAFSLRQG